MFNNDSIHRNALKDTVRPSFPIRIFKILPTIVSEYRTKKQDFEWKYKWLNHDKTVKEYHDGTLLCRNENYKELRFSTINVSRYNKDTSIWSWSWVDLENQYVHEDGSNVFRKYGSAKQIEQFYKANWSATADEVEETIAICFKLKSAIGVDMQEIDGMVYYRLVLEIIE